MKNTKDNVIHVDFNAVQNKGLAMIDHDSLIEVHWNFEYILESTSKYIEPFDIDIHIQERVNYLELPSEFDCISVLVHVVEPSTEDVVAILRFLYFVEYDRNNYTECEKNLLLNTENFQEEIASTVLMSLCGLIRHVSFFDENILKNSVVAVFNNIVTEE